MFVDCPLCKQRAEVDGEVQAIVANSCAEIVYRCTECEEVLGYWAYGSFDKYSHPEFVSYFND